MPELNGHCRLKWCSQPYLSEKRKVFEGNLQISTATLLSGNNLAKVSLLAEFACMAWPSSSTFYRIQRLFAIPATGHFYAKMESDFMMNECNFVCINVGIYEGDKLVAK